MVVASLSPARSLTALKSFKGRKMNTRLNTSTIGHAIAYCEVLLRSRDDPDDLPELRMIHEYRRILSIDSIVRILKETVDQRALQLSCAIQIKLEMDSEEFRIYLEQKLDY